MKRDGFPSMEKAILLQMKDQKETNGFKAENSSVWVVSKQPQRAANWAFFSPAILDFLICLAWSNFVQLLGPPVFPTPESGR